MKETAKTEQEMRAAKAPAPATAEELAEYIDSLIDREHEYGTCVYAMSLAATATFNYVGSKLGATGFQASCADMDVLRRTRSYDGPFMVIDGSNMLYPQYDIHGKVSDALREWRGWAAEEARKKLADDGNFACANVVAHWKMLAAYNAEGVSVDEAQRKIDDNRLPEQCVFGRFIQKLRILRRWLLQV